jgi:LPS-assembly lipoprotein
MSWFRLPAAALCLGLTACGFHPLYGEGGHSDALAVQLASIRVTQIAERYGQVMTNDLHDGLNPHAMQVPVVYQLEVGLRESDYQFATRQDGTPSRSSLQIIATWVLRRVADNMVVTSGAMKSSAGYDVLDNEYANVVSNNNGELRAVHQLSDDIQTRLAVFLKQQHDT